MIAATLETAPLDVLENLFLECAMERFQAELDMQPERASDAAKRQDFVARAYMPRACPGWSPLDTCAPRHAMRRRLFADLVLSTPERLARMSNGALRDFIEQQGLELELGHLLDGVA